MLKSKAPSAITTVFLTPDADWGTVVDLDTAVQYNFRLYGFDIHISKGVKLGNYYPYIENNLLYIFPKYSLLTIFPPYWLGFVISCFSCVGD